MSDKNESMMVVVNRPSDDARLTSLFLFESVMKNIKSDVLLARYFERSLKEFENIVTMVEKSQCDGCEIEDKGQALLIQFARDLKMSPKEIQMTALTLLGTHLVISFQKNWLNLATNELQPFVYQRMAVPTPIGKPVVAKSRELTQAHVETPNVLTRKKRKLIFKNFQGPGDIVMLTAAIRDLHRNFPGEFITDVRTTSMSLWENNPYVGVGNGHMLDEEDPDVEVFDLGYPLINQSNDGPYHFSEAFTVELEKILDINIRDRLQKGDIHIGPHEDVYGWTERSTWFKEYGLDPNVEYWVIDAGHKHDFTAKFWGSKKFQKVVEMLQGKVQFVQIGHVAHVHPPLEGVVNLIGKTDDRQLIRLIWSASGVLTPVSYPMVLAAAIPVKHGTCKGKQTRPCVVVAGGREPTAWQAYTNHQFIHTCGCLPCCDRGGCWASRVYPIGDGDHKDEKHMCLNVVNDGDEEIPFCMHMITPEDVVRRIEMYHQFYSEDKPKTYTHDKEAIARGQREEEQ